MADARDSKSRVRKDVWVRPPPPAIPAAFRNSLVYKLSYEPGIINHAFDVSYETGARGTRTPDLLHAMQTRSQLRHGPKDAFAEFDTSNLEFSRPQRTAVG